MQWPPILAKGTEMDRKLFYKAAVEPLQMLVWNDPEVAAGMELALERAGFSAAEIERAVAACNRVGVALTAEIA